MNQPIDLDQIEARTKAATPGPWGFYDGDNYADVAADLQQTSPGSYSYREKVARLEDENYWDDPTHEDDDEERAPEQMAANAAFIAHAREDVPALLAEVRRLRAHVTELERPEAAIRHVEQVFAAELADHRALTLLDALIVLRSKLPCTCARAAGLHETGCRRYVPGHELLSPALRLVRGREGLAGAAVVPAVPTTTKDGAQ